MTDRSHVDRILVDRILRFSGGRVAPGPGAPAAAGFAATISAAAAFALAAAAWLPAPAAGQQPEAEAAPSAAVGPGAVAGAPTAAGGVAARALDAEALRAVLVRGFEEHRAMDLEFVAAIPDSALRWAPTPGVRDFARQVEHVVTSNALLLARAVLDRTPPSFGDSAAYLNDREALAGLVEASYDWVLEELRSLPAEELTEETELIGRRVAKWNAVLFALQHADWTRGQLVPYFRLNGVEPPQWRFY